MIDVLNSNQAAEPGNKGQQKPLIAEPEQQSESPRLQKRKRAANPDQKQKESMMSCMISYLMEYIKSAN